MKFTFLTPKFYSDYPQILYPQIERKDDRPYAHVTIEMYSQLFCLPLRSNIDHPHAFFTNRKEKCGVDYSKAVVIDKEEYIDKRRKTFLRQDEYKKLQGKDHTIKRQFMEYIELYKKAKIDTTVAHRDKILAFSTLQYFENYIYPQDNEKTVADE